MKALLTIALIVAVFLSEWTSGVQAQATCRFVLGFESLRNQVGAQKVGICLEDEHFNLENGNAEQRTSGGLLVWRKIDNFTAFTDGGTTWVNGPNGLQSRPNNDRFSWERDPPAAAPTTRSASQSSELPQQTDSLPIRLDPASLFPSVSEIPTGYKLTDTQSHDSDDPLSRSQQRTYEVSGKNTGLFITVWVARSEDAVMELFAREQDALRTLGYSPKSCDDCKLADEAVIAAKVRDRVITGTVSLSRIQSVIYRVIALDPTSTDSRSVAERVTNMDQVVARKIRAAYGAPSPAASTLVPPVAGTGQGVTGLTVTADGLTVTVLTIDRGWRRPSGNAGEGKEFLTLEIRVDNSKQEPVDYTYVRFKIAMTDDTRWDTEPNWRDPALGSGQVLPRSSVRGWVTFKIPTGLPLKALLWSTGRATLSIPLP